MTKVFFVVTIARQVEGEIVSVRFEKAFTTASKADAFAKTLAKTSTETINVPNYGPVNFVCERGVQECDVEE